jgi:hypothetical protein
VVRIEYWELERLYNRARVVNMVNSEAQFPECGCLLCGPSVANNCLLQISTGLLGLKGYMDLVFIAWHN